MLTSPKLHHLFDTGHLISQKRCNKC